MGKLFLIGREEPIILSDEETMNLAKMIILLPEYKKMSIQGVVFSQRDLDLERHREDRKAQQKFDIDVPVVAVEKKRRNNKKSENGA